MKMRRIGETGAGTRLTAYYKRRIQAAVDILQRKLDDLNPHRDIYYGAGADQPVFENPDPSLNIADFDVTPAPSQDPAVSLAYVTEPSTGIEIIVDSLAAASYLDQLEPGATNEDVWNVLNSASADTDIGAMPFSGEDVAAEERWDQQFT